MGTATPIKLGIIGIGRAGWGMHCAELKGREDRFRIVAACDIKQDRCAMMAQIYGCNTYMRIEELIADPEVEMVDIATRSCDHFLHAKLALEAGKDVFLEKPMCVNYDEANRLVHIANASKGNLYIRHNRRFEPAFQHIREIIASGLLGDVFEVKLRRVSFQRRDDWQTIKEFGGGQLLNWGPHIIDHALCLLESRVAQMWSDVKLVAAAGDAEDHIKIVLTGENGRVVDMEISGGAAISEPEYLIWGIHGALSCTGDSITLRYLDPAIALRQRDADSSTPSVEGEIPSPNHQIQQQYSGNTPGAGFGSPEQLVWVEKTIPAQPATPCDMAGIWDSLYCTVREGAPFPISLNEALSVMQVVSSVRAMADSAEAAACR